MIKEICPHNLCTGCSACFNSCKTKAISFHEDNIGFRYPIINQGLCVDCGLCQKICPSNLDVKTNVPSLCFIGYATNRHEQETSSSGGVASLLSRTIIKHGGVVYGCSAEDIRHVHHIRVDNEDDISLLKGSKYVQSDLGDCYANIKNDLISELEVLFIGTPCQVAGLRTFLRKDYNNLFTIDFVCHGVPSQRILNESLRTKTNVNLDECSLSFRRKIKQGKKLTSVYGLFLFDKDGSPLYCGTFPRDMYITGFLSALFYRESCYQCKYTKAKRVSDITVGDYTDKDGEYAQFSGRDILLSMITLNTTKGEILFTGLNERSIEAAPIDYSKLISSQGQLRKPMKRHPNRDKFADIFLNSNFEKDVKRLLCNDLIRIAKISFITQIKTILIHVPFIKGLLIPQRKR